MRVTGQVHGAEAVHATENAFGCLQDLNHARGHSLLNVQLVQVRVQVVQVALVAVTQHLEGSYDGLHGHAKHNAGMSKLNAVQSWKYQ